MTEQNPFNKAMDRKRVHIPPETADALQWAYDTLQLAQAAVESVFGKEARPEHALSFLDSTIRHMAAENSSGESD